MTAIECLKILRKGFICLLVWNLLITGVLLVQFGNKQEEKQAEKICNLECIPPFEMLEE